MSYVHTLPEAADVAHTVAHMLLEIEAVHIRPNEPFTFTSGTVSPVYVDCRRIISFPRVRAAVMDLGVATVLRDGGFERFDVIAGGETAGIPFAGWMAERMGLPMVYVRKQPKGFGRNARIEGHLPEGSNVLLVEDLTTDGGSKLSFVDAIRDTGATCSATAVIFYYGIYEGVEKTLSDHGVQLIALCTWWDVLAEAKRREAYDTATLAAVEAYLRDPNGWKPA